MLPSRAWVGARFDAASVSIILPTFGRLEYLRATVASVYRQTLQDWELIIADDGSDAETRAYLRTLEADSRVRLLWLTHTGIPAVVRNGALREARGEYVAFLDSDDLWAPEKLSRQVAMLRSRPLCGWCYNGDFPHRRLRAANGRAGFRALAPL